MGLYNYLVAFASAMGGFLFGYEVGIIDQILTMNSFGVQFGLKNSTFSPTIEYANLSGWITFTFLIGAVVGAAGSWLLTDPIGRRMSIFVGSLLFVLGGAVQCGASDIAVLYVGRIVSGASVGLISSVVPLYISETAPSATRGRLVAVYQLMITFGILVASAVNAVILSFLTGDLEWRMAMGMQLIPALILWILIFFLPFSPRWLVDKGRDEEALTVLCRLRNLPATSPDVQEEFQTIKKNMEVEKAGGQMAWIEMIRSPGIRRRLIIGILLQFFQQWTGINVILYYAAIIFQNMGFSSTNSSVTFVIINAAINFVATIPGMWLIERIGRKWLLVGGGLTMGLSHYAITLFIGLSIKTPSCAWAAVVAVYIFTITFAASWGPVVWVYQSEIFPMHVRAKGTACCTVSNWVWNAIIARITPNLLNAAGHYTYLLFGTFGMAMALFVFCFVPETRAKSLEEMDQVFIQKSPKGKSFQRSMTLNLNDFPMIATKTYQEDGSHATPSAPKAQNVFFPSEPDLSQQN